MSSNIDKDTKQVPPPLIDLPVHRDEYCDQETTDSILERLWQNEPDLVAQLAEEEKWPFPESRGALFRKACYAIEHYLNETERETFKHSQIRLAILDLLCELSRRLRKAQGLSDTPVFGKPLAPEQTGAFPALIGKKISQDDDWRSEQPMTQELADKICLLAYKKDPALMYELCEQKRRLVYSYEIEEAFKNLIEEIKDSENIAGIFGFRAELRARLDKMCEIPSYEEMLEVIET